MNAPSVFWTNLSEQGVTPDLPPKQYKSIVLTNQISLTAALCCIPFIVFYYGRKLDTLFAVAYLSMFLFLISILINRLGTRNHRYHQFAKGLIMAVVNANIFFTASCLGRESGFHLLYFSAFLGVVLYYNFHQRFGFLVMGLSLPMACLVVLESTNYSLFLIEGLTPLIQHKVYLGVMAINITALLLIALYFNTLNARHRQSVAAARQELETVFDNSYDPMVLIDTRTDQIIECNRKAVQLFEADGKEGLIGQLSNSFQKKPLSSKENQLLYQSLQKEGMWVDERELVSMKGRSFWGDLGITMLHTTERSFYLARITDITDKRAAKERLQKSEAALREAQRMAHVGNYEFDLETGKGVVSEEVFRIFEVPETAEVLLADFMDRLEPGQKEVLKEAIKDTTPARDRFEVEYEARRGRSGAPLYLQSYGRVFFNGAGRRIRIVGTTQDITERKLREIELIKAKAQAEQASVAKQQFLSTMSHEIRTPINAILGLSHYLMDDSPRPDQADNLRILHLSAENLLSLINDILDLNKIEAGKIVFEEIGFNLPELVERIVQPLHYLAYEKNLDFNYRVDPDIPAALAGDPVRLGQVLNNLVSNAIKFTETGSVSVEATLGRAEGEEVEVHFQVTDTGIGIPGDKLEAIFDSFTQASSDTTRKYGGTGLGLTITKRLLELQGSAIHVSSREGEGSRFYFTLRFRKNPETAPKPAAGTLADPDREPLRGRKILMVEDNEINRLVAEKICGQWGIHLEAVNSGQEAIARVQQEPFDLILMDLQMPHMDGFETTRRIRRIRGAYFRKVPIVAITASMLSDVREKVKRSGMNGYVTKPFQPDDLYRTMSELLAGTRITANSPAPEMPSAAETVPEPPAARLNYGKIVGLTAGNEEFQQLLTGSYLGLFRQLKADYRKALLARDPEQLKFITNYITPPFSFLEVTGMKDEIARGTALVENPRTPERLLLQSAAYIDGGCDALITELEEKLQQPSGVVG
jgi:PAS domain S-box-containing protein